MTDMCPNEFEAMIQPDLDVISRVRGGSCYRSIVR
jgi:hypothetical protein